MTEPQNPPAGTADESNPYEILRVVLAREASRMQVRRTELKEARTELLSLSARLPAVLPGAGAVTSGPRASSHDLYDLVRDLSVEVAGPMRLSIQRYPPDPVLRRELSSLVTDIPGAKQAVFPVALLHEGGAQEWLGARALAGEEQRFTHEPVGQYLLIGDSTVVSSAVWNDPESEFVVLREPMIVEAFRALFDATFRLALSNPLGERSSGLYDRELVELLGEGLKDEAIARYLGVSLRTVRRRVAGLMEQTETRTRFQLGVAVARVGDRPRTQRRQVGSGARHR